MLKTGIDPILLFGKNRSRRSFFVNCNSTLNCRLHNIVIVWYIRRSLTVGSQLNPHRHFLQVQVVFATAVENDREDKILSNA